MLNIMTSLSCCYLIFGLFLTDGDFKVPAVPSPGNSVKSESDVMDVASAYLGQDHIKLANLERAPKKSPALVTVSNSSTEFARGNINGKRAWNVAIDSLKLEIKNNRPIAESDKYKYFNAEILIDSMTGNLLEVVLLRDDTDRYMKSSFEQDIPYMFDKGNDFCGFPSIYPKIGLIEAIEKCEYYPGVAGEIRCSYIMYSYRGTEPRPTWAITMLGLPQRNSPVGLIYNNMKCFIDATDGHGYPAVNYTIPPETKDSPSED